MPPPGASDIFASPLTPAALTDRRTFLATLGLAASRAAVGWRLDAVLPGERRLDGGLPCGQPALERIGLQLYTVRAAMARDFVGTLERVAAIGYREVEFAGYFERTAAEVKALLDRLSLSAPSAHVVFPSQREAWTRALATAAEIGHNYVTVPWIPQDQRRTPDDWKRVAELFNRAGAEAASAGLRFAYHNHDFEFVPVEGEVPFDTLLARTDPALVAFQLDLYWITKSGFDPIEYLSAHRGRFPMVHVKDSAGAPAHRMVDVGEGMIEWSSVLARARDAGTRHFFVEHDDPKDPLSFARRSYEYLVRTKLQ